MSATKKPVSVLVRAADPILRKRARELTDRERAHVADGLIERLLATMVAHDGAGLAAPQIGESLRVFVMGEESFVNPAITERSAETIAYEEGCLSIPGVLVNVPRNVSVTIRTAGRIVRLTGQSARIAQHEIDHLDGKLITDYRGVVPSAPSPEVIQVLEAALRALSWSDSLARVHYALEILRGLSSAAAPPEDEITRAVQDDITNEVLEALWNGDIKLSAEQRLWIRQALDVQDRGVDSGGVPRDPSEAAIAAALREGKRRRLSAHEVQNESMLEAQIAASVRAAYAVDRVRDSGGVAPAGGTK